MDLLPPALTHAHASASRRVRAWPGVRSRSLLLRIVAAPLWVVPALAVLLVAFVGALLPRSAVRWEVALAREVDAALAAVQHPAPRSGFLDRQPTDELRGHDATAMAVVLDDEQHVAVVAARWETRRTGRDGVESRSHVGVRDVDLRDRPVLARQMAHLHRTGRAFELQLARGPGLDLVPVLVRADDGRVLFASRR